MHYPTAASFLCAVHVSHTSPGVCAAIAPHARPFCSNLANPLRCTIVDAVDSSLRRQSYVPPITFSDIRHARAAHAARLPPPHPLRPEPAPTRRHCPVLERDVVAPHPTNPPLRLHHPPGELSPPSAAHTTWPSTGPAAHRIFAQSPTKRTRHHPHSAPPQVPSLACTTRPRARATHVPVPRRSHVGREIHGSPPSMACASAPHPVILTPAAPPPIGASSSSHLLARATASVPKQLVCHI
ncbi:hypothetical protein B0H10DRAFT_2027621, partial [Mycena sp. CBHHK59/15]